MNANKQSNVLFQRLERAAVLCEMTGAFVSSGRGTSIPSFRESILLVLAGLALLSIGSPVLAAVGSSKSMEELIVTSRKRDETLSDVPVTLTAFSKDDIYSLGIRNLEDISDQTPGLFFTNQGDQRGGRSESVIRFRGMSINDISPVRQLATVFEDGVFVSAGLAAISMEDIERVEVIKGPQSAYFGRSTFGGAVNFITRQPSTTEFGAQVHLRAAEDSDYDASLSLDIPLIKDKLAARFSGRYYTTDGRYTSAADGGALGEEETKSAALAIFATPTDNLSLKFRAFYGEDDDGLPPTFAVGPDYYNCGPFFTGGKRFICGDVPVVDAVSLNTTLDGTAYDVFVNNSKNSPTIAGSPQPMDHRGMSRDSLRLSLAGDWGIGDSPYTIGFIAGYNSTEQMRMTDTDHTGSEVWVESNFQDIDDLTLETTVSFDNGGRFQWLLGVNYFDLDYRAPTGATVGWLFPNSFAPNGFFFDQTVSTTKVETTGLFGSISYDITDTVNLSLEGRYQIDDISEDAPGVSLSEDFKNFLPRVILQWQPLEGSNYYVTIARGNMPGNFNGNIVQFNDLQRQEILDQSGATEFVDEAELTNFELGLKQSFFDGIAYIAIAAYYSKWTNQQSRGNAVITDPTTPAGFRTVPVVTGDAKSDLWGLEFETILRLDDHWTVRGAYNWAASEVQRFECLLCERVLGTADVSGNDLPRFPEHSGSIGVEYADDLVGDWSWFARGDTIYTGSAWSEFMNLAESSDFWVFNLRGGVELSEWRLEAFVTNVFDDDNYRTIARSADFAKGTFDITDFVVNVSPANPRQVGARVSWRF